MVTSAPKGLRRTVHQPPFGPRGDPVPCGCFEKAPIIPAHSEDKVYSILSSTRR